MFNFLSSIIEDSGFMFGYLLVFFFFKDVWKVYCFLVDFDSIDFLFVSDRYLLVLESAFMRGVYCLFLWGFF